MEYKHDQTIQLVRELLQNEGKVKSFSEQELESKTGLKREIWKEMTLFVNQGNTRNDIIHKEINSHRVLSLCFDSLKARMSKSVRKGFAGLIDDLSV